MGGKWEVIANETFRVTRQEQTRNKCAHK